MSAIKWWLEEHFPDFSYEKVLNGEYSQEEMDFMRKCLVGEEES